ncbi:MAG: CBS domain-containing protein [candidate division WS1 bacterium]|jgi:Zn-dependent protease|nr:CBS domain-containing protein [candidate division WS1 bacterium]
MHGWHIGRLFNIAIEINFTWLIIFGLILWSVTANILPGAAPDATPTELWITGLITTLLFFGSLVVHELSHSIMANRLGAEVSRITLFVFGGVSQMKREPDTPSSEFKIAIVGPLSSVILGGLFIGLYFIARQAELPRLWYSALLWVGQINFALAIFNMLPGFPLDGGRVLRSILWNAWDSLDRATRVASNMGRFFGYGMIGLGFFAMLFGGIGGLWLVALGWLLSSAAGASYQRLQLERALGDVYVHDLMSSPVQTIPANATLQEAAEEYFMTARFSAFGVDGEGELTGIIRLDDLQQVPREQWGMTTVSQAMQQFEPAKMTVNSDVEAVEAMMKMAEYDMGRLLVTDHSGNIIGIISQSDIRRLLRVRGGLGV